MCPPYSLLSGREGLGRDYLEANLKRRNPSEVTAALLTSSSTSLTCRLDWEKKEYPDRQADLQNKE